MQKVYLNIIHASDDRDRSPEAQAASDLYYAGVSGLHGLLSLRKKIAKAEKADLAGTAYQPFIDAADRFERELIGLAGTVRDLKGKVVKGRAPRPEPVPTNPDQVRGTCPCCFSIQAIRSGTMVHHGYQRPGDGFQTASCPGIKYKPFERSPDGTQAMIDSLTARIEKDTATLAERGEWVAITNMQSVRISAEHPNGFKMVTFKPGDKGWDRAVEGRVFELEQALLTAKRNLEFFEERKAAWVLAPLHKADRTVLPLDFEG
ncbi:hypothetical protein [Acetobacter malorum]|uniref:hypothetical protein n=1 Tax=Acetobacter malorum TaxID=178901 RepID=UPI0012E8E3C4|nr:hypothetical protein [Acetobacter malorum]